MQTTHKINISVIIPAYNYGMYLEECLRSVAAQTYPHWECIIIDNGSTDNTAAVAKGFVSADPRFVYEYTAQKGVSFARNRAVEISRGSYILPLDADDKIAPAYLEKALVVLEKHPEIRVVYGEAELFGAMSGPWHLPPYTFRGLLIENPVYCTALFRKADFETAGGFDEEMKEGFEDWDFWIRMLKRGGEVFRIPEVCFYYRMRPGTRNSVLHEEKQRKLRRMIYQNHRQVYEENFSLPDLIFENYLLRNDLAALEHSPDQKLGRWLLAPLRYMKKLFKKRP